MWYNFGRWIRAVRYVQRKMQEILGLSAHAVSFIFFAGFLTVVFYFLQAGQQSYALWFGVACGVAVGLAIPLDLQANLLTDDPLQAYLTPATDPSPSSNPNFPPVPAGAVTLHLGNCLSHLTEPATVVLRVQGEDLLSLKKGGKGVLLSATLFSGDGRIVAHLIDNEFVVNPNNYFRLERPDRHTLVVYDQKDQSVLYVRFLNPAAIKLLCFMHAPSPYPSFVVTEEGARVGRLFNCSQSHLKNLGIIFDLG